MKPSRSLALAAAFTGCAVAYGIHVFGKQETAPTTAAPAKSKPTASERTRSSFKPVSSPAAELRARPDSERSSEAPVASAALQTRKVIGSPIFNGDKVLTESQWRENATKVEMEANHELNRLTALLDLDSIQQEKIFSSLARQSPYWLPGMQTGGNGRGGDSGANLATTGGSTSNRASGNQKPGTSRGTQSLVAGANTGGNRLSSPAASQPETADVTAYLSADQQQSLVEEEMDRQEWWAEILPQLLPPTIPDTAAATEAADAPAETKVFDGGGMLPE